MQWKWFEWMGKKNYQMTLRERERERDDKRKKERGRGRERERERERASVCNVRKKSQNKWKSLLRG